MLIERGAFMKKNLYLLISFTVLLIIAGCKSNTNKVTIHAPSITFAQPTFNFGTIIQGTMVAHKFKFKNTGTSKLIINNVTPTCNCTAAITSSREIEPGKEGEISVHFDSVNYSGMVTKTIMVATNDQKTPVTMLTLTGDVTAKVVLDPSIIFFGSIKKGAITNKKINVQIISPGIKITSVTSSTSFIKVSYSSESITRGTINVDIVPDATLGPLNAFITVFSTSKSKPFYYVPVIGNIVGDIITNPGKLNFGIIKKGITQSHFTVSVSSQHGKAFKITGIEIKPNILKITSAKQNDEKYRLNVFLKPGLRAGMIKGNITLYTTLNTMRKVEIPFNGFVINK